MPRWRDILLLAYSASAYTSLLLFELYGRRPSDSAEYTTVSSFYGPGVYLGWWLVAASIVIRGAPSRNKDVDEDTNRKIGTDLMSVIYYVGAALLWSIFRAFKRHDAELEAGVIVMEAAADMSMAHIIVRSPNKFYQVLAMTLVAATFWVHNLKPTLEHATPAILTIIFVFFGTAIMAGNRVVPRTSTGRRLLILTSLLTLWPAHGLGTYRVMPRVGERMITWRQLLVLDQLASLVAGVLTAAWPWRAEIQNLLNSIWTFVRGRFRRSAEENERQWPS